MRERISVGSWRGRDLIFGVCAACTLWLLVQNAVLFALIPWERLPGTLHAVWTVLRAFVVVGTALALIGASVAAAWWRVHRTTVRLENGGRHV